MEATTNVPAEQEQKNREKYGSVEDDVIARTYREDKKAGDVWCLKNVEKYGRRFISNSSKSNNIMDLYKMRDYLNRAIAHNEALADVKKEEIID